MHTLIDTACPQAKNTLQRHHRKPLILKNARGHQLARFMPPKQGWTPWDLWQVRQRMPPHWFERDVDTYLGTVHLHHFSPHAEAV